VLIHIRVERTQPLAGTATTVDAEPRRFDGWLELLTALSELVAAVPSPDEQQEAAEEPIQDDRMGDDREEA
jgi:hypothetical protein